MKKLMIVALLGFAGWKYYQQYAPVDVVSSPVVVSQNSAMSDTAARSAAAARIQPSSSDAPRSVSSAASSGFRCDGRQYCSQMRSRAEAEFFVRNCPNTKMDGDRDGIPCENDSRF